MDSSVDLQSSGAARSGLARIWRREAARFEPAPTEALRARYEAYCVQQAERLTAILPQGGVGALYRAARGRGPRIEARDEVHDLGLLATYAREILPLPPFEVWRSDFFQYPVEHADAAARPDATPSSQIPAGEREVDYLGEDWTAVLMLRLSDDLFRGHLLFVADAGERHRTGEVFQEQTAAAARSRFESLDVRTLVAFLRSVLP